MRTFRLSSSCTLAVPSLDVGDGDTGQTKRHGATGHRGEAQQLRGRVVMQGIVFM